MKDLKQYTDMQKLTGMTDMEIIIAYFVDNDMEEEMMEISHSLAKAKIEKMRARKHMELDYIVNGEVTGARLEWAKANLSDIEKPKIYFQPCARWLEEHGIKFKEDPNAK